jgi:tetratricopeptide (TPR) repeat protein
MEFDLNKYKRVSGSVLIAIIAAILISPLLAGVAFADNYIEAYFTGSGSSDTLNSTKHFLRFGEETAIFLPPYTIYFTISPMGETSYTADVSFHELLPGLKTRSRTAMLTMNQWQAEDSLPGKGEWYRYSYRISKDTFHLYDYLPSDSLVNNESIHFHGRVLRDSYADYKWRARQGYLESYFDSFRKEQKVTRIGKLNLLIFPAGNYSSDIDINRGLGFDIPHGDLYLVYNENFDSALPENIQRFILYETWGYSARSLVVGFARYYLDDIYQAKKIVSQMNSNRIKRILLDESPTTMQADIICGAFAKYIIDKYSLGSFRLLYEKSSAGNLATKEVFGKSIDKLTDDFIDFANGIAINQPAAAYYSEAFRSQLWYDRAIEYDAYLSSGKNSLAFLKRLASNYFYIGDFAKSESCYTRLAQFKQEDLEAQYLAAAAKLRSGKIIKGVIGLKEVAPRFHSAAKMLAEYYLDQNYTDSAAVILSKLSAASDSWTSILRARLAIALGEDAKADSIAKTTIPICETTIEKASGEGRGYIDVGYCQLFHGDFKTAEIDFQTALFVENRPYYRGSALLALGRLNDLRKNRAQAVSYYNQAILEKPGEYITSLAKSYLGSPFKLR